MGIINDLFYGKLSPYSRGLKENSEHSSLAKEWRKLLDEITADMPKDKIDKLNQFIDMNGHLSALSEAESYELGFRYGVRILLDALIGDGFE